MNRVAIFVLALFAIQTLEGTALYFSFGCGVFILIAAFAFNTAGGLSRASGAYIFAYSVLVVIIGLCYKAFLGEPAESNLQAPISTIEAYVGSITAMYAAVVVSRRFSRRSGLLQHILKESEMYRSSVGCIVLGVAGAFVIALLGESAVRLQTAFAQLNDLVPLGIIIGVMYEIRRSGGSRSINIPIAVGIAYVFFLGMTGFSKEGMLIPLLCWFLPVAALRFRLATWQIIACFLAAFIIFHYLVPFSQYGRGLVTQDATLQQRIDVAVPLLEHPEETRRIYEEQESEQLVESSHWGGYYNTPQGFWDRLQFISVDDSLIDFTNRVRVVGFGPIIESFANTVPRIFWPN